MFDNNANTVQNKNISLKQYYDFCLNADMSPNFHPNFVEFYYSQLKIKPQIIGRMNKNGQLIAAYPVLYRQIFPNSLHKKILGKKFNILGDIGQPEIFFPVLKNSTKISLNNLSPTTSPLLKNFLKRSINYSIKSIAIAKKTRHKNITREQKKLLQNGGKIYFTDEINKKDFVDIYIRLHCKRWGYMPDELRYVRKQIIKLYKHIHGGILLLKNEPLAAQLCFKNEGKNIFYVDFINLGVKAHDKKQSYGSIMMLSTLRKSEHVAFYKGKKLRFSFGYYQGKNHYKSLWTNPEPTFIAF
ncbi:acetyltransferase [Desulfosarcina widdelii]|uniref:Acetyltransferase n=1 Tax=Desulfosarcina widdelii TaxID=947919 RepID=A0A5K7YT19_9BACT|nr:hypothetical protein [Desulfosarcina widdelii]BBO72982.1 acetyltransferase [Desulfosarcina widdelii]